MHVEKQMRRFDEKRQRTVLRCDVGTARTIVGSPSLAELIEAYAIEFRSERMMQRD